MRPPRRRSCSRTVGRRFAQRRCDRGSGRAGRRRRPLRRRGHRGRRGRSGRCWPRRRRWVVVVGATVLAAAVVAGAVLVGAAGSAAGLAGGVGGPATNPTRMNSDTSAARAATGVTSCFLRYQGRPGRGGAAVVARPLRRRLWRLVLPGVPSRAGSPIGRAWQPTFDAKRARTLLRASRTVGSLRPSARPRRFGRHVRGLVILLSFPAVTPQVRTARNRRARRCDQQEPHSHARAGQGSTTRIERSWVRIPPRAPKPQVRAYVRHLVARVACRVDHPFARTWLSWVRSRPDRQPVRVPRLS
jgi:hypothetical protein